MKVDKILLTYAGTGLLFLGSGALLLVASLIFDRQVHSTKTLDNAPSTILLGMVPVRAGLVNAIFVFITFTFAIPTLAFRDSRFWLKVQGWMIVFCSIFTLILGLIIWIQTLRTRAELNTLWGRQTSTVQSFLQQKFNCCGYYNSTSPPFVTDTTCPTALIAEEKQGCVGPFSNFANRLLDLIFTAAFGIVVVDVILLLCVAVVVKDRKEKERYRFIDAKVGYAAI